MRDPRNLPVMRVLVTGAREWPSRYLVFLELNNLAQEHNLKCGLGYSLTKEKMTVVHGYAYRGADRFADEWAECYGIPERHEAKWRPGGVLDRGAGHKRNQEMVDLGADICLAFLMPCTKKLCKKSGLHYTHGTWDCVTRAQKAGIPVREVYHKDLHLVVWLNGLGARLQPVLCQFDPGYRLYDGSGAGLSGGRHGSANALRAAKASARSASPAGAIALPSTASAKTRRTRITRPR